MVDISVEPTWLGPDILVKVNGNGEDPYPVLSHSQYSYSFGLTREEAVLLKESLDDAIERYDDLDFMAEFKQFTFLQYCEHKLLGLNEKGPNGQAPLLSKLIERYKSMQTSVDVPIDAETQKRIMREAITSYIKENPDDINVVEKDGGVDPTPPFEESSDPYKVSVDSELFFSLVDLLVRLGLKEV